MYRALLRVFVAPGSAWDSEHRRRKNLETVAVLLSAAAHRPGIFEELVDLVERAEPDERTTQLFARVFSKTFDKPVDPIMALNTAQVERLLEAVVDYIRRHPSDFRDGGRLISDCANPAAVDWVTRTLADPEFFEAFDGHLGDYDPLPDELRDNLQAALEWHQT